MINQIRGTLISAVSAAGLTLLDQAIKCGIRTLPEGSVLLHIPLLVEITHYTKYRRSVQYTLRPYDAPDCFVFSPSRWGPDLCAQRVLPVAVG